jgi:hypothetical protein
LPITANCPQPGHWRGSHSLSSRKELHSWPERGITTITVGAKARQEGKPPSTPFLNYGLRSYLSETKLKENHNLASGGLAGFE